MGVIGRAIVEVSSKLSGVVANLVQEKTNGSSRLGTFLFPLLAFFLGNLTPDGQYPWGNLTDWGNNQYTECPITGAVRTYDFVISRGVIAPDGYQRDVLLVNGAFPGPLIEANWGDKIVVNVFNNISSPEEGTSIHWHGFLQRGTPWDDGAPGVSQCPIAPGKSYTYEFKASLYGSSWYHAHYSAQYAGGIVGPIVVHGPTQAKYDFDLGPVMLSDWYHRPYFDLIKDMLAPGGSPRVPSDNNLINGKMNFDCAAAAAAGDKTPCTPNAGIAKFKFQTGKTHRLRLVNSGADGVQRFSIDGHTMTVIANDFVPVKPYNVTAISLAVGQRADVLVTANAGTSQSAFWMRSDLTRCSAAKQPLALAAVYYDQADPDSQPTSQPWADAGDPNKNCGASDDLDKREPLYPISVTATPAVTKEMKIEAYRNASDVFLFKFDGVSARVDYNHPALDMVTKGNMSFPEVWNVRDFGDAKTIRLVINQKGPGPHPMHLHGHNFYVLSSGPGDWDGKTIVRSSNPVRRDVEMIRSNGHLVLQFDATNPGVWAFHCHIAWHASEGFFSSFVTQPEEIQRRWGGIGMPGKMEQVCREWDAWSQIKVVDQIDSGT
ncbi:multicopper oxidase-domain-containing protein [Pseudoneurospora amorphoporcata]|uniref:Multicopper oxidase-domain-containing protein n=1 Tax=Pseudoneurospora amorphoporcata TaxID=241081 RepID=A0AAN6NVA5_9PEZI|nr:multicopper oxidase-domain-containing protein [Pseudoneurospora amorphoporcata]